MNEGCFYFIVHRKSFSWSDFPNDWVSQDGSMGWVITRLKVKRQDREFIYAGIMTYEKRGGRWVRVANVSTFQRPK